MFRNEPFTDFTILANRARFQEVLAALDARIVTMSLVAGPIINGVELSSEEKFERVDPSNPDELVGTTSFAQLNHVEQALDSLERGFHSWSRRAAEERCQIIRAVGARMRKDRVHLAALIIRESGKNWREADADVAEAIDFCDYYAEQFLPLSRPFRTEELVGEDNVYLYKPRGIFAVIAPWNFPLAILCGMSVAALVCGNVVALKPAEQTCQIAAEFMRILLECGIPGDACAFLPGRGEVVGDALVRSPRVHGVVFTGSKTVGLSIIEHSSKVHDGQYFIKKVIAELGGKNAIIVDEDADLDEAIKGVTQSAFGFSGQKCSACSRVLVVGDAYEPFMERFIDATSSLIIGVPSDPATAIGPVIDSESAERINKIIEEGAKNARLRYRANVPQKGFFASPAIFSDIEIDHPIWRDEIFGPVVACRKTSSLLEALSLANNSPYALTGGIFSRSPESISLAREQFEVGNLYINRTCTGALVGRQPFGGFKLSGVGSKAGGKDYLLQFLEPRTITENTLRRGFAPST
jgi:RHH-type proline utilization regulon transcriptional repressor/proline dehydrogenase/delta 1-pyrroline-5-carboxylate dehydrogenase